MMELSNNNWYIKNRYLFLIFILSFVITIIVSQIFLPDYFSDKPSPLSDALFPYLLYGILFYFTYKFAQKASIDWRSLFGSIKIEYFTSKYILLVIPLISLSLFSIIIFYLPFSFWFPEFVNYWLIEAEIELFWFTGANYKLANGLIFFNAVIIAPIIEEIFFRGFLFTSLANKWTIKKAVILSSISFGILHSDLIGGFIFGIVMCILYLNTKSLFVPIIIHIANNSAVYIFSYFLSSSKNNTQYNLTDFQGDWWIGLVGLIIGLPWLIYFYKKEVSENIFNIPYFLNEKLSRRNSG